MKRASGILMHVSSLPSNYGIGTFSKSAYEFVNFLVKAGQKYWQILPLGMTSFGDSPYQSPSVYAGNINFIDFDTLVNEGYLSFNDIQNIDWGSEPDKVDYVKIFNNKTNVLKKAVEKFDTNDADYLKFCNENDWLANFALFMAIKESYNLVSFNNWDKKYILKDKKALKHFISTNIKTINFYKITQFWFFSQFFKLKEYANSNNIKIIGDIPFYAAYDSADVWANPELFELDENLNPTYVAGVPPDFFSKDGQLWGNPLYNFKTMEKDNYRWWKQRIEHSFKFYDVLRIDHFRAFDSYYAIPYGEKIAKKGVWRKGVGKKFFNKLNIYDKNIIVEDLGDINDSVRELVRYTGFPNIKVLQFAYNSDKENLFLPQNFDNNCVVYTGTHDNMTTCGWLNQLKSNSIGLLALYSPSSKRYTNKIDALLNIALSSKADMAIIPMQDYLELDNYARMNTPSTLGDNWQWRVLDKQLDDKLAKKIYNLIKKSDRI